jgi:ribosomal protein S27AE
VSEEKPFCKRVSPSFLKKHLDEYKEWVREPLYVCTKCGRVARRARDLCRPVSLESGSKPGTGAGKEETE